MRTLLSRSRSATALAMLSYASLAPMIEAQPPTGRAMNLVAPLVLGQTAQISVTFPASANGNPYTLLWSSPPFAGVTPITVPGLTVSGVARINPNVFLSALSGLFSSSGVVSHTLAIPNQTALLGSAWDAQSLDLAVGSNTLYFADNDLTMAFSSAPPTGMIAVAPGTFMMGSNATTGAPYYSQPRERPVHQVTISRLFWIGRYEVTQAEYQAIRGNNPSFFQGASWPNSSNRPVEQVTWNDAMAYCAALTVQQAALGRVPSGYQYRLPTEAEWEYCCRSGTTSEFHYGSTLVCSQARIGYSYHSSSSCNTSSTAVVGGYTPNALGLHNMHGNVWEWCLDYSSGVAANYPNAPVVDPYVNSGTYRIVRGGGWDTDSSNCRSAWRRWEVPSNVFGSLGFRVVLAPLVP